MNLLLAGNAQDTRPCQPSYTTHPAPIQKVLCIFMHLYTPLALILLFWLTSVAALACGRSTNVQSWWESTTTNDLTRSFWEMNTMDVTLNCFQCFVKKKKKKWEYIIPKIFVQKLHLHTRSVQQKDQTTSCVCGVILCFQVVLHFQARVTVMGLFLPAIFTRDTNTLEPLGQPPASIFYPRQFRCKTLFAPLLLNKTDFQPSLPTFSALFLYRFPRLTTVWHCEGISRSCENDQSQEESLMQACLAIVWPWGKQCSLTWRTSAGLRGLSDTRGALSLSSSPCGSERQNESQTGQQDLTFFCKTATLP